MRTLAELDLLPVWVNSSHLASTASHIMRGHGVRALAVVDNGELKGTVSLDAARVATTNATVHTILQPIEHVFHSDMPISQVAQLFVQSNIDYAPVIGRDGFLGMVSAATLLRDLGRSRDPLTGLSWSDVLREWGINNLRSGREITILFLDIDAFGIYNKQHGHIIGDRVLKSIASVVMVDHDSEVIVRYGGDEFAVGTLKDREMVEEMAARISEACSRVHVEGVPEGVTVSVGVAGGKRSKERDNTHYAATLDNLINLASKDCLSKKRVTSPDTVHVAVSEPEDDNPIASDNPVRSSQPSPLPVSVAQDGVILVTSDEANSALPTTVSIMLDGQVSTGIDIRGEKGVLQSVARANEHSPTFQFRLMTSCSLVPAAIREWWRSSCGAQRLGKRSRQRRPLMLRTTHPTRPPRRCSEHSPE